MCIRDSHRTITKTLNKFKYYLKISTIKEYMTKSVISLIQKIPVKHLVISTDIKGNGRIEYTSNYVRIEDVYKRQQPITLHNHS